MKKNGHVILQAFVNFSALAATPPLLRRAPQPTLMNLAARLPSRIVPSFVVLLSSAFSCSAKTSNHGRPTTCRAGAMKGSSSGERNVNDVGRPTYYRRDGVRITHDPYAPDMAKKYGEPGSTDNDGFDPYADSVGAGIYSGTVQRRESDGSVVIGKQYQGHNPRPGPVYSGGGYTPVSRAIALFRGEVGSGVDASATTLGKLLDAHPDLVNDGALLSRLSPHPLYNPETLSLAHHHNYFSATTE